MNDADWSTLHRRGPNFKGRIRDMIKALQSDDADAVDRAAGHLIGCCKGEMIFRRAALKALAKREALLRQCQQYLEGNTLWSAIERELTP